MRAQSYPGRSPILRSASQRTAAMGGKGRQGTENEHGNQAVANPQLQVQPLTLTGTVAIHEDDAQNHQEETQPGSVLGPKGVERGILSSCHLPKRLQPAHPTSLSQIAPLPGSSSNSAHGLLPDPDNSLLRLRLYHFIHQMWMLTRPPRILLRTGLGGEQTLAKGVSRGTSMPSLPFCPWELH